MEKKSDLVIVSLKDFPQHVVGTKTEHDLYADHYPSDEELENERLKFKTPWQEARNKFVSLRQSATMEPKDLFDYLAAYAVYSFDAAYFRYFSSADFVNGISLDREYYVERVRAYEDCCEMRMTPRV